MDIFEKLKNLPVEARKRYLEAKAKAKKEEERKETIESYRLAFEESKKFINDPRYKFFKEAWEAAIINAKIYREQAIKKESMGEIKFWTGYIEGIEKILYTPDDFINRWKMILDIMEKNK